MNILRTNLSSPREFLSPFKDLNQIKPATDLSAKKNNQAPFKSNKNRNFLTYNPKSPQISDKNLSSLKNSFDINLKEVFNFAKDAVRQFQKMISSLNTANNPFDNKKTFKDIKTLMIESFLWKKKGMAKAYFDSFMNINEKSILSSNLSDLLMSYSKNFSLKLDISFEQKQMLAGNLNYSEFNFELDLKIKQETQINYGWQEINGEGLRVVNANTIDTGRYYLQFESQSNFIIYDKTTAKSTRIWGDPHIDLSDVKGDINGEFSDLKQSFFKTTFMLQDGTKVLFNAPDNGFIESVIVTKNTSAAFGIGTIPAAFTEDENNFVFSGQVSPSFLINDAGEDVVYAGGDGNDWFDKNGNLVWGDKNGA